MNKNPSTHDTECRRAFEEWLNTPLPLGEFANRYGENSHWNCWQACWQRFSALEQSHARLIKAARIGLSYLKSDYIGPNGKYLTGGEIAIIQAALAAAESIVSRQGEE